MSAQPAAQLGELQSATDVQTPFGGRARTWTTYASLWVQLTSGGASADQAQDQQPVRVETARAGARDHPNVAAGQQLLLDGPPWRVLAVQRPERGRMILLLDRPL